MNSINQFIANCNFSGRIIEHTELFDDFTAFSNFLELYLDLLNEEIDLFKVDWIYVESLIKLGALSRCKYILVCEIWESIENVQSSLPGWIVRVHQNTQMIIENVSYRESLISPTGFWTDENLNEHAFDQSLADGLLCFMKLNNCYSILDLGCGPGEYVKYFKSNGQLAVGYDGNPNTQKITNGLCHVADLTSVHVFEKSDCVISLEVGEHIPAKYESIFIENVCSSASNRIVISWAIPGQGGYGHINCLENKKVVDKFRIKGWSQTTNDLQYQQLLRLSSDFSWFKNTILVFSR
jgi:hypothetical protein